MALAEMCKARIAVHRAAADELAAKLQALGCCEFVNKEGEAGHSEAMFRLREKRHHVDELIGDAKFLIRLLEPYETKKRARWRRCSAISRLSPLISLPRRSTKRNLQILPLR